MKIILFKLTDKITQRTSCTRNQDITKRIHGSEMKWISERQFIQGDHSCHSVIYENDLFKLEIVKVEK
jgi:hypothetical protein